MILSFSGDPFLAPRAAKRALAARGFRSEEITELGEGMLAAEVEQLAAQSGLFGQVALLLDFDAAFKGQAGVKPRNAVVAALGRVADGTTVVVIDCNATASRQKTYRKLGELDHLPTPRFEALVHWVRGELKAEGVRFGAEVPQVLADLFGEDLPSIASEILKLSVLDEELSGERVLTLANRLAARDAFDLIEAMASGNAAAALTICRSLTAQGEAPQRVMGALAWQFHLVARCVGFRESRAKIDPGFVAQTLKLRPFVAKKALGIARKLDEARLRRVLGVLVEGDVAMKTGKDERWALESMALRVSGEFEGVPAGR
jgi:DNA polymerase-3 subunit delta